MSSDGSAADAVCAKEGSKTPPTPPGSPVDRPFPVTKPVGKEVLEMIREEGDGCRRDKSDSKTTKKSSSRRSTDAGIDRFSISRMNAIAYLQ